MWFEEDNNVGIRKAPLLELNGVKEARNIIKDTILNVMNKRVKLSMKDTCDQVRMFSCCLIVKQSILDLWPGRVGSHCDEKVSSSKIPVDGQGILKQLLHVMCSTRER